MRIALAQTDPAQGDFEKNLEKISDFAKAAKDGGAQLAVFPEMCVCGFDYKKNLAYLQTFGNSAEQRLREIAKQHGIAICGSLPHLEVGDPRPSNRMLFIGADGNDIARYDKIHLFGVFRENRHVKAGDEIVVADSPFGKIGLAVCYDIRFPDIFVRMAKLGAKMIILSAAFPHPRSEHWRILSRARAIENQCFFVAVNRSGSENFGERQIKYFGMSAAIDPWGGVIAECPQDAESLVFADINLDEVDNIRAKIPSFADRRDDIY